MNKDDKLFFVPNRTSELFAMRNKTQIAFYIDRDINMTKINMKIISAEDGLNVSKGWYIPGVWDDFTVIDDIIRMLQELSREVKTELYNKAGRSEE